MHQLELTGPRPYFAEVPYYLWGQVNYDSEGDCERPTDRNWTWLYLQNRETREELDFSSEKERWSIDGPDPTATRAAFFFGERCGASVDSEIMRAVSDWDHAAAMARAERVEQEFGQPDLAPFDSHLFWGSWKWIGWFATDRTWVGRWIMHSVVRRDPRAVNLCIEWLRQGTVSDEQSAALRCALNLLTGVRFNGDQEWLDWYDGPFLSRGHKAQYPEPDFDVWLADLKAEEHRSG